MPGYTGSLCDGDIDECADDSLCSQGSSCVNTAGGFLCVCPSNLTGEPRLNSSLSSCQYILWQIMRVGYFSICNAKYWNSVNC